NYRLSVILKTKKAPASARDVEAVVPPLFVMRDCRITLSVPVTGNNRRASAQLSPDALGSRAHSTRGARRFAAAIGSLKRLFPCLLVPFIADHDRRFKYSLYACFCNCQSIM